MNSKKVWFVILTIIMFSLTINSALASTIFSQTSSNSGSNLNNYAPVEYAAFSFRASNNDVPANVSLYFAATTGSPTGFVRIALDNAGSPSSNFIANSSGMSLASGDNNFILTNNTIAVVNNSLYWVVFARTSSSANYPQINWLTTNTSFSILRNNASNAYPPTISIGSYTYRMVITGNPASAVVNNFTLTSVDAYDSASISNFSATINGVSYNTTSGSIITNVLENSSTLHNITFYDAYNNFGLYFNKTYSDYNVSSNLQGSLEQTSIKVLGFSKIINQSVNGDVFSTSTNLSSTNNSFNVKAGSYNLTFFNSSWYNKTQEFTFSALDNKTVNIADIYDATLSVSAKHIFDNSTINNFSININTTYGNYSFIENASTTNGSYIFKLIQGFSYSTFIDADDYAIANTTNYKTATITNSSISQIFYLYKTNSINFLFKDLVSFALINWTNVTIQLIGDYASYSFSTTNGTYYATLLTPSSYVMRYSAPSTTYVESLYYFTLVNQTTNNLTLYLANSTTTTNITVNILDQYTNPVENAIVESLRYDVTTNTYLLQEIVQTDINGDGSFHVLTNEFYKFIVIVDGSIVKTTNPAYITGDVTIQINTGSGFISTYTDYGNIKYNLSFNNNTDTFKFDFNDLSGLSNTLCLTVYVLNVANYTTYNQTCQTTATGSILITVTPTNGTFYYAAATYISGSYTYLLDSLTQEYGKANITSTLGVLLQILITFVVLMISKWSIPLTAITVPFSLIIGYLIGIFPVSLGALIALQIGGVILAFIVGDKS